MGEPGRPRAGVERPDHGRGRTVARAGVELSDRPRGGRRSRGPLMNTTEERVLALQVQTAAALQCCSSSSSTEAS